MTTSPDPFLLSSRDILRRCTDDIHAAVEGLPAGAINWKPAGDETNSIAVLAFHSLLSTRQWLSVALDSPLPERDRESEFEASFPDPAALLRFVDDLAGQCRGLLKAEAPIDWSEIRHDWDPESDLEIPAAWALIHAIEHLREHVGQIGLTRQLWEARTP